MIAPLGEEIGPTGLEPPAVARNRRKATVNIRRNPLLRFFFSMIRLFCRGVGRVFYPPKIQGGIPPKNLCSG